MQTIDLIAHTARWEDDPGPWWPIFPIAWLLLIAGIATLVYLSARRRNASAGIRAGESRLAERYASGDIDEEEYAARLAVLRTNR